MEAHSVHGGEHSMLVHSQVAGEEEKAAFSVRLGRDRQEARLRLTQLAAVRLTESLELVLRVGAIDRATIHDSSLRVERLGAELAKGFHAMHFHGPAVEVNGEGGPLQVVYGAHNLVICME